MARKDAELQKRFLPDTLLQIEGVEITGTSIPAKEVGEDFYDVMPFKMIPLHQQHLGVMIADVSGKGVPAALFMLPVLPLAQWTMPPTNRETLASGDLLVLYTDGITEAVYDKEEMFEIPQLLDLILTSHSLPAQEIITEGGNPIPGKLSENCCICLSLRCIQYPAGLPCRHSRVHDGKICRAGRNYPSRGTGLLDHCQSLGSASLHCCAEVCGIGSA